MMVRKNVMRDQYATDISDYLKFAFLRAVCQQDRHLGIAWYYLPGHDGRSDGHHKEYNNEPAWRILDEQLYDQLKALTDPSVAALERLMIWPARTVFHRDPVAPRTRAAWVKGMVGAMADADIVFLDPDNGLGRGASKHVRIDDLIELRRENRALSIIKFPGRHKSHQDQISDLHRKLEKAGLHKPLTVNTCVRTARVPPRHRFFTIVGGDDTIRARAEDFVLGLNGLGRVTGARAGIEP
jgi:hypothetical protein